MNLDDLQIATPRLLLRVPRAADLDPWAEMMTDEEVARVARKLGAPIAAGCSVSRRNRLKRRPVGACLGSVCAWNAHANARNRSQGKE